MFIRRVNELVFVDNPALPGSAGENFADVTGNPAALLTRRPGS
jgi:hypothetical protein